MSDGHDNYYSHTPDEGAPQQEHTSTVSPKVLGLTLIFMILGVLVVILGLVVYFNSYMSTYNKQVNETDELSAATWEAVQEKKASLESYAWVDSETVRIPLSDAIEDTIAEYAQD
jgi:cytoskeletal protein RodZ